MKNTLTKINSTAQQTVVVHFSSQAITQLKETSKITEAKGKLASQIAEQKLMHSVLENDQKTIDHGKIIQEALNRGIGSFTPDVMFEHIVKNYSLATQLFGETLLRLLLGYEQSYLERNLRIPEFARELKQKLEQRINELKDQGLLDNDGFISDKGIDLAAVVLYVEELESLHAQGLIDKGATQAQYGEKSDLRNYKKGDSYKSVAIRATISKTVKRGRTKATLQDISINTKISKGKTTVIYALDASASMKGTKLELCKKAGIALAYKAISRNDSVGIISFASRIKTSIEPTTDFSEVLHHITKISAAEQTNFNNVIDKTLEMFPNDKNTKHLLILTDALPTVGTEPEKETINAVARATNKGITTSVIGINLDAKGTKLAENISRAGKGRFFVVKNLSELDKIVLEDYYALTT